MAKKSRRKQSRKKKNSSPEMAVSILVASPAEERKGKQAGGPSRMVPPEMEDV